MDEGAPVSHSVHADGKAPVPPNLGTAGAHLGGLFHFLVGGQGAWW